MNSSQAISGVYAVLFIFALAALIYLVKSGRRSPPSMLLRHPYRRRRTVVLPSGMKDRRAANAPEQDTVPGELA